MRKTVIFLLIGSLCGTLPLRAESEDNQGSVKYVKKATPSTYGKSSSLSKWQKTAIAIGVAAIAITTVVLVADNQKK